METPTHAIIALAKHDLATDVPVLASCALGVPPGEESFFLAFFFVFGVADVGVVGFSLSSSGCVFGGLSVAGAAF